VDARLGLLAGKLSSSVQQLDEAAQRKMQDQAQVRACAGGQGRC
jgi:hypothetical protein